MDGISEIPNEFKPDGDLLAVDVDRIVRIYHQVEYEEPRHNYLGNRIFVNTEALFPWKDEIKVTKKKVKKKKGKETSKNNKDKKKKKKSSRKVVVPMCNPRKDKDGRDISTDSGQKTSSSEYEELEVDAPWIQVNQLPGDKMENRVDNLVRENTDDKFEDYDDIRLLKKKRGLLLHLSLTMAYHSTDNMAMRECFTATISHLDYEKEKFDDNGDITNLYLKKAEHRRNLYESCKHVWEVTDVW